MIDTHRPSARRMAAGLTGMAVLAPLVLVVTPTTARADSTPRTELIQAAELTLAAQTAGVATRTVATSDFNGVRVPTTITLAATAKANAERSAMPGATMSRGLSPQGVLYEDVEPGSLTRQALKRLKKPNARWVTSAARNLSKRAWNEWWSDLRPDSALLAANDQSPAGLASTALRLTELKPVTKTSGAGGTTIYALTSTSSGVAGPAAPLRAARGLAPVNTTLEDTYTVNSSGRIVAATSKITMTGGFALKADLNVTLTGSGAGLAVPGVPTGVRVDRARFEAMTEQIVGERILKPRLKKIAKQAKKRASKADRKLRATDVRVVARKLADRDYRVKNIKNGARLRTVKTYPRATVCVRVAKKKVVTKPC